MAKKLLQLLLLAQFSMLSFGNAFDSTYQIYSGDINGNGRTDFYIRSGSTKTFIAHNGLPIPIPTNKFNQGEVRDFLLIQNSNKSFSINSALSSSQLDKVLKWRRADLELKIEDYNLDGKLDVGLAGVSNEALGANNQIVFAPSSGQSPQILTEFDDDFEQFVDDVFNWLIDPNYFEDNAPTVTLTTSRVGGFASNISVAAEILASCAAQGLSCVRTFSTENPLSWMPGNAGLSCFAFITAEYFTAGQNPVLTLDQALNLWCSPASQAYIVYVEDATTARDYTVFDQGALMLVTALEAGFEEGELITASPMALLIEDLFELHLGTTFMGGVLSNTGTLPSEVGMPVPWKWLGRLTLPVRVILALRELASQLPGINPEMIFRVHNGPNALQGESGPIGVSWTPNYPLSIENYRDRACLPDPPVNKGTHMSVAILINKDDPGLIRKEIDDIYPELRSTPCTIVEGEITEYILPVLEQWYLSIFISQGELASPL